MSHAGKVKCEKCQKDITLAGSRLCRICDPDIDALIEGTVVRKTPQLCDKCLEDHKKEHEAEK